MLTYIWYFTSEILYFSKAERSRIFHETLKWVTLLQSQSVRLFCLFRLCLLYVSLSVCLTLAKYCAPNGPALTVASLALWNFTPTMNHVTDLVKSIFSTRWDCPWYYDWTTGSSCGLIAIICGADIRRNSSDCALPVSSLMVSTFNVLSSSFICWW